MAVAATVALIAALSVRWHLAPDAVEDEPREPVVGEFATAPPARERPAALSGNDSSVNGEVGHLILTGTQVAANPQDSLAFIGTDPRNPQTYAVNSVLVNGARVREIARDHVLLERDGAVARVEIDGAWNEPQMAASRLTRISVPEPPSLQASEPRRPTLTDALALSPVFDANGMLTSYRLRPGRQAGIFARWGLEPGDQLVAIENAPLTDLDSTAQALLQVGRGERLNVTVMRRGGLVAVVLDGSAIEEESARARAATESLMSAPPG